MGEWTGDAVEELKKLYIETDVPSDQLVKDKNALDEFVAAFNTRVASEDEFSSKEVADQLFKLRKASKLPRIRD